jgi:hypothetical protein
MKWPTNVPYLGGGKQDDVLIEHCQNYHPEGKADLSTCFIERSNDFCARGATAAIVTKQEWLFLGKYQGVRRHFLSETIWGFVARLGPRAFTTISGERVNVSLHAITNVKPGAADEFFSLDVAAEKAPEAKALALLKGPLNWLNQLAQLKNQDSRVTTQVATSQSPTFGTVAESYQGIVTGDLERFRLCFWEVLELGSAWVPFRTTVSSTGVQDGCSAILLWEGGIGTLHEYARESRAKLHDMHESGNLAWQCRGIALNRMGGLQATVYTGEHFDNNVAVLVPREEEAITALLAYCTSPSFPDEVRKLDKTLKVTNRTLVKVPFDLAHWQKVAAEKYPHGLPKPLSSDPTQWLFNGHPKGSDQPLQVAVTRLLGYQWPRQTSSSFPDCPTLGPDGLEKHADPDGIVCLSALQGERPGADRLRALLADAYGHEWSASKQAELLSQVSFAGKKLEDWLRDGFFEQHCDIFHQRPFVWHIWDGLRDGFHALVNYHKLVAPNGEGRRTLEKLIYTYLGDWIDRQRADQKNDMEGADARVAAAEHLKSELQKILAGEQPYDVFVRWKSLQKQSIGWEPDLNDGVRINIRPCMTAKVLNRRGKGTCILRTTPRIKWDKDRGQEPQRPKEDFPWFWSWDGSAKDFRGDREFDGNRWNDLHYTRKFKEDARE